jgi:hypothetical protein
LLQYARRKTSRGPQDLLSFNRKIIQLFSQPVAAKRISRRAAGTIILSTPRKHKDVVKCGLLSELCESFAIFAVKSFNRKGRKKIRKERKEKGQLDSCPSACRCLANRVHTAD